jgi:hypothetical protein
MGRSRRQSDKVDKYPRVSFRLGDLREEIESRQASLSAPSSPNEVAQRDLKRYYGLLVDELPAFSEKEAVLILKAVERTRWGGRLAETLASEWSGGRRSAGRMAWPPAPGLLWAFVDAATHEGQRVSRQHSEGVDAARLVKKLRALSSAQAHAVLDAVERGLVLLEKGEEPRKIVTRLGLAGGSDER